LEDSEGRLRTLPRGAFEGNTLLLLLGNELADTMEEVDPRRDGLLGLLAGLLGALWSISMVMVMETLPWEYQRY
jgi:hypothetical protein